jgi:F0F1-type ATP synthase epsilon subunit
MSDKPLIKTIVRDTENILYEGYVDRITAFNEIGQFDVYPMHANFISILTQQVTLYHNKEKVKELKIEKAVMKVKKDVAQIFLGIETFIIDEEEAASLDQPQNTQKPQDKPDEKKK